MVKPKRVFYCDGSCSKNGKLEAIGGWCYIEVDDDKKPLEEQKLIDIKSGLALPDSSLPVTNIRMEMMAVLKALEACVDPSHIHLYTDCAYIVNSIEKGWYTKWLLVGRTSTGSIPANLDLWKTIGYALKGHEVQIKHVKGHNGHRWQEFCDTMAVQQTLEAQRIVMGG